MTDRESLQSLLEDFRTAGQNLQLEPLVTQKALAQFGVEYQTELIDQLERAFTQTSNPKIRKSAIFGFAARFVSAGVLQYGAVV